MYAIQVEDACKQYKNGANALNGLDLTVKPGEIFSLLGPNGAGKSTLIRVLTTYITPDSGRFQILGKDILKNSPWVRSKTACVAQQTSIDTHLSLEENMLFQSRLYRIPGSEARQRMEDLIGSFELDPYRKRLVRSYSGGIRRRLDIALNMMSDPGILFLDEPTVGMDIQSRLAMWNLIRKIRDDYGTTVFLTTHYLEEAEMLSDTICIMQDGKSIAQGTPFTLRQYLPESAIQIKFITPERAADSLALLARDFPHMHFTLLEESIRVHTADSAGDLKKLNRVLLKEELPFRGIEITRPSLEDVFLCLTKTEEVAI